MAGHRGPDVARLPMRSDVDFGEVVERARIGGYDGAASGFGGGGNDQVVSAARSALPSNLHEQQGVFFGDLGVVADDGHGCGDLVDERGSLVTPPPAGEERSDPELGQGDRGYRDVIVVGDEVVKIVTGALGVDQEGRVEEEATHSRRSTASRSRTDLMSVDQARSGRCRRSSALASAPRPPCAGSRWATVFPRRTMVKCSPRCSTASRRSAKFRAASVA